MSTNRRPFIGVSLKAYLGHAQTRRWLAAVAALALPTTDVDVAVLPAFTALADARHLLRGTGIGYGAQDCFWHPAGPYTGEITPDLLHELGCTYVEVGHAERRSLFGEDNHTIAAKITAAGRHGLTPIICIGEPEAAPPSQALATCLSQLEPALNATATAIATSTMTTPIPIIAYEPVWAIGAHQPADPEHVNAVVAGLRQFVHQRGRDARIIYGGSAQAGLLPRLTATDGLFLGRAAHDTRQLATAVTESLLLAQPGTTRGLTPQMGSHQVTLYPKP